MPYSERGFAPILILIIVLLALVIGGFFLKSQGKLSFSNQVGTNQSPTPSDKTAVLDFAAAMKELGCSDQSSCTNICSKPENADKCKSLMQGMNGNGQGNSLGNSGSQYGSSQCQGNPALVNGPTDPQLIKVINTGNTIKADSRNTYLQNFNANPIPIIAPADGKLIYIEYKTRDDLGPVLGGADYDLEFRADCNTIYRINHITNPTDAIRALSRLKEPAKLGPGKPPNQQDTIPIHEFMVKAGDQLGTTTGTPTAHNWDFVVFVNGQATCPYNLLPVSQRPNWLNLLSSTDKPTPGTPCDVSGGM